MIGSWTNLQSPWLRLIPFRTYCRRMNDLKSRLRPFTMCIYRIAARYTLKVSALIEHVMYVAKYTSIFSFAGGYGLDLGAVCSKSQ